MFSLIVNYLEASIIDIDFEAAKLVGLHDAFVISHISALCNRRYEPIYHDIQYPPSQLFSPKNILFSLLASGILTYHLSNEEQKAM